MCKWAVYVQMLFLEHFTKDFISMSSGDKKLFVSEVKNEPQLLLEHEWEVLKWSKKWKTRNL